VLIRRFADAGAHPASTLLALRDMASEVSILNHRAPFRVHVVAPQAPTDDLACVHVITSASAMGHPALRFVISDVRCGVAVEHCLENSDFLLGCMFGAGTKLNWTIAVIMPLHRQTADALAVIAALPIVSDDFAKVAVH
jgi:hypothetical protein